MYLRNHSFSMLVCYSLSTVHSYNLYHIHIMLVCYCRLVVVSYKLMHTFFLSFFLSFFLFFLQEQGPLNYLVDTLLAMCERDVVDHHKFCSDFFWLLNKYATMVCCFVTIKISHFTKIIDTNVWSKTKVRRSPISLETYLHKIFHCRLTFD